IISFIIDSGCSKHITGNLKLLSKFMEQILGTVKFGNDQIAPILGFGDLVKGNGLLHRRPQSPSFSVGHFCDADLEVAFWKSTCFVRDLQGNDLLISNRGSDLYTISLQQSNTSTLICLMAKASLNQAWIWHRRLSYLNFDYINLLLKKDVVIGLPKLKYVKEKLCSSCEVSKATRSSLRTKTVPSLKGRLNLLRMHLCGPMRVDIIKGKKYILVIVDDYSRYTWTIFLRFKDETPEVLKYFLMMIQRNLQAWDPCILVGYSTLSKGYRVYNKRTRLIVESIHLKFDEIKEMSETSVANDTSVLVPQWQKASDYDNSDPVPQIQNVLPSPDTTVPSQQEFDLLFVSLYDEFFNAEPTNPTNENAEENNDNQAEDEFTYPFCTPVREVAESYSCNIVQTRRQLTTDPEMCMFVFTVSTVEPKNIKEAMDDSAWINAMQEELHQFDRLQVWELVDKPFGKKMDVKTAFLNGPLKEEVYVAQCWVILCINTLYVNTISYGVDAAMDFKENMLSV
nr:integrase, catalytic region, zinc finger, CCHC-type, peptidase aspartic, catalytic [Tanacetum cinerariifolium]